jgi:hypothetical protein
MTSVPFKEGFDINDLYPGGFIKAADVKDGPLTLTIDKVTQQEMRNTGDIKPVLSFTNESRELILNVTNCKAIAEIFGNHTSNWAGCMIELYGDTTEYSGSRVPCLRVRRASGAEVPEPPTPEAAPAGAEDVSGTIDPQAPLGG